jgi:SAM-dependent methyltransferase
VSEYYERNFRPFLPDDRDAAILDIGFGQGDFVRYLHGLGYRNITAIDSDERAVAALEGLDGVTARQVAIGDCLPVELAGPWELIIAKQMIYYLDRREAANFVRSLSASLASEGRLIVEIFNGSLLSSRFTEQKDPGILTAYTELGLKRLLEGNGLKVEHMAGAKTGSALTYRMLRKLWFAIYRGVLVLERGKDDELPTIGEKFVIAVARRA